VTKKIMPKKLESEVEGAATEIAEQEAASQIDVIREKFADEGIEDGYIHLERRGPLDVKFSFVAKIPVQSLDVQRIMELYGGGDYKALGKTGNGAFVIQRSFSVDPRVKGERDLEPAPKAAPVAEGKSSASELKEILEISGGRSDSVLAAMMGAMTSSQQSMAMMISESNKSMMQSIAESNKSNMALLAQVMTMMTTIASQKPAGLSDLIAPQVVELLKVARENPLPKTLEMMRDIKEMFVDEGAERPGFIERAAEAILPALAASMAPKQLAGGTAMGTGAAAGSPAPGLNGEEEIREQQMKALDNIKAALRIGAENESDPSAYAVVILDQLEKLPAFIVQPMMAALAQPEWVSNLFGGDRFVIEHVRWYGELREYLLHPEKMDSEGEPEAPRVDIEPPPPAKEGKKK